MTTAAKKQLDTNKLNSFRKIEKGKTYVIKERTSDVTDPKLLELGRRKAPNVEMPDLKPLKLNRATGKYDMGLDETSMFFNSLSDEEIKDELSNREYIIECCKRKFGKNFLENCVEGNAVFDGYVLSYKHERYFNTNNIDDAIELHNMLLDNKVCFPDEEMNDKYMNSATHIVECVEERQTQNEINAKDKHTLREWFSKLHAQDDISQIVAILRYFNENVTSKTNVHILSDVWNKKVENATDRKIMMQLNRNDNNLLDYIQDLDVVIELIAKGVIKNNSEGFFYGDVPLGGTKEDVLANLGKDKDLFNSAKSKL